MIKILISPAKSLNLTTEIPFGESTNPVFSKETTEIISKLKEFSVSSLGSLLGVSDKLAQLNWNLIQTLILFLDHLFILLMVMYTQVLMPFQSQLQI